MTDLGPSATSTSVRHAGGLAGARHARPAAHGSPRLRQGLARRHGRSSRPRTATGCGAIPSSPVRAAGLGRQPARRAEPDRWPGKARPVVSPRAQRQRTRTALDQLRAGRRHHGHHEERATTTGRASTGWTSGARWTASSSRRHAAVGRQPADYHAGPRSSRDERTGVDRRPRRPRSLGPDRAGGHHPRGRADGHGGLRRSGA